MQGTISYIIEIGDYTNTSFQITRVLSKQSLSEVIG